MIGVALSVAVMLLSVAVSAGFKGTIERLASNVTGDVVISRYGTLLESDASSFTLDPALRQLVEETPGVRLVSPVVQSMGLIKTDSSFVGVVLYGVDSMYNRSFYAENIVEGRLPDFTIEDSNALNPVLLPEAVAKKLNVGIGDRIRIYFSGENEQIRIRAFTVEGLYKATAVAMPAVICHIGVAQRVAGFASDEVSLLSVLATEKNQQAALAESLTNRMAHSKVLPSDYTLGISMAQELNPEIYSWLDMLDANVYILLLLLSLVSGFTVIAGLVVLVLDKTRLIGTLKAMGATERQCRAVFLRLSMKLALKGLFWGNVVAVVIALVQHYAKIVRLDPETYYMEYVPIAFDLGSWILVNVCASLLIFLMIIGPTHIVSRIRPATTLRFD